MGWSRRAKYTISSRPVSSSISDINNWRRYLSFSFAQYLEDCDGSSPFLGNWFRTFLSRILHPNNPSYGGINVVRFQVRLVYWAEQGFAPDLSVVVAVVNSLSISRHSSTLLPLRQAHSRNPFVSQAVSPRLDTPPSTSALGRLVKPDIPDLTSRDPGDGRGVPDHVGRVPLTPKGIATALCPWPTAHPHSVCLASSSDPLGCPSVCQVQVFPTIHMLSE